MSVKTIGTVWKDFQPEFPIELELRIGDKIIWLGKEEKGWHYGCVIYGRMGDNGGGEPGSKG